jgi:hypothetical protein
MVKVLIPLTVDNVGLDAVRLWVRQQRRHQMWNCIVVYPDHVVVDLDVERVLVGRVLSPDVGEGAPYGACDSGVSLSLVEMYGRTG